MSEASGESDFRNVYDDERRAGAYAELGFPGTYHLAFRDLPGVFSRHVVGRRALDFGCGTGRSSRFLQGLGFDVLGVDISRSMLEKARQLDPGGHYRHVTGDELERLPDGFFDLVLSTFTFDNIATREAKASALAALRRVLRPSGRLVSVVSAPEIYVNEWASFSTKEFPENRRARSGDRVRIVMLDVTDARPVEDVVCTDEDYRKLYREVGFGVLETSRPLATGAEPVAWKAETRVAPWVVWVLAHGE